MICTGLNILVSFRILEISIKCRSLTIPVTPIYFGIIIDKSYPAGFSSSVCLLMRVDASKFMSSATSHKLLHKFKISSAVSSQCFVFKMSSCKILSFTLLDILSNYELFMGTICLFFQRNDKTMHVLQLFFSLALFHVE